MNIFKTTTTVVVVFLGIAIISGALSSVAMLLCTALGTVVSFAVWLEEKKEKTRRKILISKQLERNKSWNEIYSSPSERIRASKS